jgi:nucleoside-diphosphate-sugar epimerase
MNSTSNRNQIGVLGATSFVGTSLLACLAKHDQSVIAFSRRDVAQFAEQVTWRRLDRDKPAAPIPQWICLAPITVLPDYFTFLENYGAHRIIVLSSTSRFTKTNSRNANDQCLALQLAEAEERVQTWAEANGIEWIILRPTLIYGLGQDKNISEIARFIRRFGFFSLFDKAFGLRQPIHVNDVANACVLALQTTRTANRAYNISGAEVIRYRDMVLRIFSAMKKRPRLLSIPLWVFSIAVSVARCLPRYRKWTSAMAERMNIDMAFDHSDAARDFGFQPRAFELTCEDIP